MRKEKGRMEQRQSAPTLANWELVAWLEPAMRYIMRRLPRRRWRLQHIDSSLLLFAYAVNLAVVVVVIASCCCSVDFNIVTMCIFAVCCTNFYRFPRFVLSFFAVFVACCLCNSIAATPTAFMLLPAHCLLCSAARLTHLMVSPTPR